MSTGKASSIMVTPCMMSVCVSGQRNAGTVQGCRGALCSHPCPVHISHLSVSLPISLSLPLSLILSLPPFITLPHSPARALDKLKKQIQAAKEEKKRLRELKAAGIDPASVKKQEVTGTALNSPLLPALAPTSPVSSTSSYLALSSL
jgi:hypothetical protein